MIPILKVHHIAIIASDYPRSKYFYTQVLGFEVIREVFRETRNSYKLDLSVNGQYTIELFSFPSPPARVSHPEACGLRHLAFEVSNMEEMLDHLKKYSLEAEPVRMDEFTHKKFTFIADPDGLPIEFYEI
jgi:glyoxylase I family protein